MNAKQWLSRARFIDREIALLQKTKEETRDNLTKITQNYENDGAQMTKDPHKFDRLAEINDMIDRKQKELIEAKAEIMATIFFLSDSMQRTVLLNYYVRGVPLKEIAVMVKYSYRQTRRFHDSGVVIIDDLLKREGDLFGSLERPADNAGKI